MPSKPPSSLFPCLIVFSLILLLLYSYLLLPASRIPSTSTAKILPSHSSRCNLFTGRWVLQEPVSDRFSYNESCPFQRNAWNCLRNQRPNMGLINSWKWVPTKCDLPRIDPGKFLSLMRNRNIGFVGDSLNENFLVSFLCVLRVADSDAKKWKRKGAWRGGYFPKYNVTVAYHRAVLLADYRWQPKKSAVGDEGGVEGINRVNVDIPAAGWSNITNFYDVLVFNTGHWWGSDKFPKEKPLVFYQAGKPINPQLGMVDGFKKVLENMVSYIEREVPSKTLKFWRLQSPRHFYGGEWNQNGSCLFDKPLKEEQVLIPGQLDLWFDPSNNGVNKEARQLNRLIQEALQGRNIQVLDLTHLSEFRADAHPAIWLGKKDAVAIWGQDCMHWCLPGLPDTWVDILAELIHKSLETGP